MFLKAIKIEDVKQEIAFLVKSYRKKEKISQEDLTLKLGML